MQTNYYMYSEGTMGGIFMDFFSIQNSPNDLKYLPPKDYFQRLISRNRERLSREGSKNRT